jgi:hypothetical protein
VSLISVTDYDSDAFDEDDYNIGFNYHNRSPSKSPKKQAIVDDSLSNADTPKKTNWRSPSKKGKRKRDDYYSDVAPSGDDEDEEADDSVIIAPSRAKNKPASAKAEASTPSKKRKAESSSSPPKRASPNKSSKKKKKFDDDEAVLTGEGSDVDDDGPRVVGRIVAAPTTGLGAIQIHFFTRNLY